jgi:hypothetical protein
VQLQLQVVPGRPAAIARVDPDRVGVPEMVGVVAAAAGQVDAADEGDAADRIVRAVDDQQLLVVAAEATDPLVGHQLPAGPVDQGAQDPVGVLVEVDQGRVGAPQRPPDGHSAAGQPHQQRTSSLPGPASWRLASMRQSARYSQSPASSFERSWCRRAK